MSKYTDRYIYSENLINYYKSTINEDFCKLSPEDMINKLTLDIPNIEPNPTDVSKVYTSRDVQEIRRYFISIIRTLTDDWSDFNESDIGITLIELMSGIADMLGFYLDKQALECYIGSVKQRKNGLALLNLINYRMGVTRATTTLGKFTLNQSYDKQIIIPKYTQVSALLEDKSKIYFATAEEVIIPIGGTEAEVTLIQGVVNVASTDVGTIRNNQKIVLSADSVAEKSMIIKIDGFEWTQVPDVLVDDVAGTKYSIFEDKNCKSYILFHNSYKAFLPDDNNKDVDIQFLVSLGTAGKIKEGIVNKVESEVYYGDTVISNKISVTNLEPSSGGADRETLDEARKQAPKTLAMLGRVITLADIEAEATRMQGIVKCKAIDWSVKGDYVRAPFIINLYTIPTDGYELSSTHKSDIVDHFSNMKVNYQNILPMEPDYVDLDLDVIVYAYILEKDITYLNEIIKSSIENMFKPANLEFGMHMSVVDIRANIVQLTNVVSSVDIPNMREDIYLRLNQFLRLGELNIELHIPGSDKVWMNGVEVVEITKPPEKPNDKPNDKPNNKPNNKPNDKPDDKPDDNEDLTPYTPSSVMVYSNSVNYVQLASGVSCTIGMLIGYKAGGFVLADQDDPDTLSDVRIVLANPDDTGKVKVLNRGKFKLSDLPAGEILADGDTLFVGQQGLYRSSLPDEMGSWIKVVGMIEKDILQFYPDTVAVQLS